VSDRDKESISFLIKDSLIGGIGGALAGVVIITILCLPYFAVFAFVFWLFLKFY